MQHALTLELIHWLYWNTTTIMLLGFIGLLELIHWLYWNVRVGHKLRRVLAWTYTLVVLKFHTDCIKVKIAGLELIHWLYWNLSVNSADNSLNIPWTYTLVVLKWRLGKNKHLSTKAWTYTLVVLKSKTNIYQNIYLYLNLYIGCIEIYIWVSN